MILAWFNLFNQTTKKIKLLYEWMCIAMVECQ